LNINCLILCFHGNKIERAGDETTGSIKKLSMEYGIHSDRNYLNDMLREGNCKFDSLLEIEEEL
jgi:hypothetical protein